MLNDLVLEIAEAEQLILTIDGDGSHPVNDRSHRHHQAAKRAFIELNGKLIAARAQLEMENLFKPEVDYGD
jgi:hypothetical protein